VTNRVVRAGLVGLAVLVLAWLALGVRAVRLEDQADAVVDRARAGQPVSDAEARRTTDRLDKAGELSPDHGPLIKIGQLTYARGQQAPAALLAAAVTVEEPDNLQAWFLAWAAEGDPRSKEHALDEMRRLNPYIDVALGLRDCLDCPLKRP
jgi:hypothetical protein